MKAARTIRSVRCSLGRSVRIDSRAAGRKAWNVTYVSEGAFRPVPGQEGSLREGLLAVDGAVRAPLRKL